MLGGEKLKKLLSYLSITLLIISAFPTHLSLAQELSEVEDEQLEVVLFAEKTDDEIEFFDSVDSIINEEPTLLIPDDTVVELLENPEYEEDMDPENLLVLEDYVYIRYVEDV